MKENVIIGRLIPAGTGYGSKDAVAYKIELPEFVPKVKPEEIESTEEPVAEAKSKKEEAKVEAEKK